MMGEQALFCGVLVVQLKIPGAASLKDRRQVTRSLLERARSRFNVSSADLGPEGSFQDGFLAFSAVSSSPSEAGERLDLLLRMIRSMEEKGEFLLVREIKEVERYAGFQD